MTNASELARLGFLSGIELVTEEHWDDSNEDGDHIGGTSTRHINGRELLMWCMEDRRGNVIDDAPAPDGLELVHDLRSFMQWFTENFDQQVTTKDHWDRIKQQERRRQLEGLAAQFIADHKLRRIDNIEALDLLEGEIRRKRSRYEHVFDAESRAERYATYAACGNRSNFFADEEYLSDRMREGFATLEDVQEFISTTFPLLWAEWLQSRQQQDD